MRGPFYLVCLGCMALGILAGRQASSKMIILLLAIVAVWCAVTGLLNRQALKSVAIPAAMLALGLVLMFCQAWGATHGALHALASRRSAVEISGRLVSEPAVTGETTSFFVETGSVTVSGTSYRCRERVLVRVEGKIDEEKFYPGAAAEASGRMCLSPRSTGWLMDHGAASILEVSRRGLAQGAGAPDPVSRMVHGARRWFSRSYERIYPPASAGLMEGITLSKLDHIDPAVVSDLRSCGLSHIIAVSGLHVGSVAALTLALFSAFGAGRRTRFLAACLAGGCALALSNFRPSAVRAFIMAGIGFGGIMTARDHDSLAGLSIAGAVILAANPRALFDPGFQFSFAAALGIVISVRGRSRTSGFRVFLAVCAGAQLGVLPLMVLKGEGVPVTAIAANMLVVPLIGPLLLAGWGTAGLASVCRPLASVLAWLLAWLARYVMAVAAAFSRVPTGGLYGSAAAAASLCIYVAALVMIVRGARSGASLFRPATACAIALLLALLPCSPIATFSSRNRITVLDVGEGDACLIQDRSGAAVLVDGGPDGTLLLEKLRRRGVRKLDVVVSTHPHADHISGLVEVMENLPVGRLVDPGLPEMTPAYRRLVELAASRRIPRTVGREGQVLSVSEYTRLEVLYAPLDLTGIPEDVNDCSLVLMARVAGMRALLSGDASCEAQEVLLGLHPQLECDIVKVPHHGAREAAGEELYAACKPALAAISYGRDNRFGHPSSECLRLLSSRGIRTEGTERDGDIELSVDSGRIGLVKCGR